MVLPDEVIWFGHPNYIVAFVVVVKFVWSLWILNGTTVWSSNDITIKNLAYFFSWTEVYSVCGEKLKCHFRPELMR